MNAKAFSRPPAERAMGTARYDDVDLCRLRVLVSLRGLGLSVIESGQLASQCAAGQCDDMCSDLLPRLASRRAEIAAARVELEHLDAELVRLEGAIDRGAPTATLCLERRDGDAASMRLPVRA
jgi:DNA-binding transcriptional MerR regulator